MFKWLLSLVFIVRVTIPMGHQKNYEAKKIEVGTNYYYLTLTNDKLVYVPIMFTTIEEK